MNESTKIESEGWHKGSISFEFPGGLAIREFADCILKIDLAYSRLNAFLLDSEEFRHLLINITLERKHSLVPNPHEAYGLERRDDEFLGYTVTSALRRTTSLNLGNVRFSSPGFAEFIGNINPLKVIADFITAWRHENTLRDEKERNYNIEKLKVCADVTKSLIEHGDRVTKACHDGIFAQQFVKYTMYDAIDIMESIARDNRFGNVTVCQQESTKTHE